MVRYRVLLVEDNPADVRLTRETLRESPLGIELDVAPDGAEALDYLFRRGHYRDVPRPDLVLLDLNLPKVDGYAVLQAVKTTEALRMLPVVVLTTSRDPYNVQACYRAYANAYLVKPIALDEFMAMLHSLEEFWFSRVLLPSRVQP